jgi:hypothetical protein
MERRTPLSSPAGCGKTMMVHLVHLVDLVCFVYLVHLVYPVSLVHQINETNQTNQTTVFLTGGLFQHPARDPRLRTTRAGTWRAHSIERLPVFQGKGLWVPAQEGTVMLPGRLNSANVRRWTQKRILTPATAAPLTRIIHDGSSRSGGVARDKDEERLVSLVYLICLVCLVEPDKRDRPDEPDQPSLVPPVSLESGIRACSRSVRELCGLSGVVFAGAGTQLRGNNGHSSLKIDGGHI